MSRTIVLRVVLLVGVAIAFGLIGYYGGLASAPAPSPEDHAAEEAEDAHDHGSAEVVTISRATFENLGIATKTMRTEPYVVPLTIPGQVVEIPGRSSSTVASPVGGNVRAVHVDAGQLVQPQDILFTLEIVDEPLLTAQIELLDVLGQTDVTRAELDRLAPLAQSGAIAGRQSLEVEYELQKLQNRRETRVQELTGRGLTPQQVATVIEQRELIKTLEVRASDQAAGRAETDQAASLVVESLGVHPGMTIARGTALAVLADHRQLYVRGEAFEQDVPDLYRLQANDTPIEVQFGHSHTSATERNYETREATIAYIDNHADPETGTFYFYLRIQNEVAADSLLLNQATTRQWRFKPGQRVHLRLPLRQYEDQFVLPREAVVEEGIEAFAFQQVFGHVEEGMVEFEKVPVRVLHRDTNAVVIDRRGEIRLGDTVVVTQAYQLYLELLSSAGDGGGHAHHGHSH